MGLKYNFNRELQRQKNIIEPVAFQPLVFSRSSE